MKKQNKLFFVLMFLPVIVVIISLLFLPDTVPMHYNMSGEVDRWGSKYEMFIFPVVTIAFGVFMLLMEKFVEKQEKSGTNNKKVIQMAGIGTLLLFNVMNGYFLYTSFTKTEKLGDIPVGQHNLFLAILAIGFIVLGNVMPKVKMNSVLGLRTSWSMKNETTWKLSQRFGGISLMVVGAMILLVCLFTKGNMCLVLSLAIVCVNLVVDVVYTYQVAKKYS